MLGSAQLNCLAKDTEDNVMMSTETTSSKCSVLHKYGWREVNHFVEQFIPGKPLYFYFHSCSMYLVTVGIITAQCKMSTKISFVDLSLPLLTIYMSSLATQIFDLFRVYNKSSLCKIKYSVMKLFV